MSLEPVISVVIITYNHEKYIRQALESVLRQEVNVPVEILVGEDVSTDATREILMEYRQDERVHLFFRNKNMGASANLYDLLKRSRGQYIAMLEGDDYWLCEDKLQRQYDFLETHSEFIGCAHECMLVDESGNKLTKQYLEWISKKREFEVEESKGFYLNGQMGTLLFRNIFRDSDNRYDIIYKAHPMISDRTVQLVLALNGRMYRLNDCMSAYRQISSATKENATSLFFVKNIHRAYDNFILTDTLEDYSRQYANNPGIDFSYVKKLFFVSAVYQWIRTQNPEIKEDVRKIFKQIGTQKWKYVLFLPQGVIHKLLQKRK